MSFFIKKKQKFRLNKLYLVLIYQNPARKYLPCSNWSSSPSRTCRTLHQTANRRCDLRDLQLSIYWMTKNLLIEVSVHSTRLETSYDIIHKFNLLISRALYCICPSFSCIFILYSSKFRNIEKTEETGRREHASRFVRWCSSGGKAVLYCIWLSIF